MPKHYTKGTDVLKIAVATRIAGAVTSHSRKQRAALDSVCPEKGLIFRRHDYRDALRRAAVGVLPPEKAERLCREIFVTRGSPHSRRRATFRTRRTPPGTSRSLRSIRETRSARRRAAARAAWKAKWEKSGGEA